INTYKYLDKLSEICEYIKSHYQENLTLSEVADIYGYSPQYLSRIFKKYTGTTFLAYLHTIRLNAAYKQIAQTDYSILMIAEDNGFSNVKALNKLFKETYGMTPTAYRKQIKK
ncbi:MAG: AraC family transcriptional regulator, partial [Erysipelotrichaceae bacterium]|nr:AraC family transcriptional regulator [Erysipelotrichaceae bacterium]